MVSRRDILKLAGASILLKHSHVSGNVHRAAPREGCIQVMGGRKVLFECPAYYTEALRKESLVFSLAPGYVPQVVKGPAVVTDVLFCSQSMPACSIFPSGWGNIHIAGGETLTIDLPEVLATVS